MAGMESGDMGTEASRNDEPIVVVGARDGYLADATDRLIFLDEADTTPAVVVVDPLPVPRQALGLTLRESGFELVAQCDSAAATLRALERLRTGTVIALVSITLAGEENAFWLIRAIRDRFPTVRILAHGGKTEPILVSRALFCGADGFLDHSAETERFVAGIHEAARGETVLVGVSPQALGDVVRGVEGHQRNARLLSPREIEVLQATANGCTAREVARRLGLSERTVTTHLSRIYNKLGTRGRAAIATASRIGLITIGSDGAREPARTSVG